MSRTSVSRWGRRVGLAALTGATLASTACGSAGRGSGQPPAVVIFSNESLDQAAVYVVAPGSEFRKIGTVIPGRTEALNIPGDLALRAGTLNIVARLLARNEVPQTGPVTIRPGERYQVRLTTDVRMLSFLPES